ncbi:hypothetical protein OG763_26400 [Streptomyces sp. NBC_01230]|uniref:hypothetical protein n=1 Tax=Streptomyces sp. NBC_01230 TaxID=2903784 RepID=UPI002E1568F2|nr:hypothetical protein OG763_26400 [Streptomyces sp. NBC_01230]
MPHTCHYDPASPCRLRIIDPSRPVNYGESALKGDRQSLPSLLMVSRELAAIINRDYATETAGREYLDHLTALTRAG